jgi:ribonucleoside-diphosphate reductase alpha chain
MAAAPHKPGGRGLTVRVFSIIPEPMSMTARVAGSSSAGTGAKLSDGPAFTPNARTVLEKRYLLRKDGRLIETPAQLLDRVARGIARAEARHGADPGAFADQLRGALERLELLPNSPTLMNAGRPQGQLAACFVLPVEDNLNGIFDAVKWAACIQQTGGGTGFSFSRLRPAGDIIGLTEGAAGGPVPFIEVFDAATDAIKQGGVRRGANMAVLRVDHPDILQFIAAKSDLGRLTNFNVSVAVTDAFMEALAQGGSYPLYNPRSGVQVRTLEARRVWDLIAKMAWQSGEPGILFFDRINAANPTPQLGDMEATNPCGELPLLPFEACNLASIDVGKFVVDGPDGPSFDWARLRTVAHLGVRMLDDVIDENHYPLPQIEQITQANRKIGLGVMGLADAFVRLGVAYDSEAAVEVAERLAAFLEEETVLASEQLARERGPFANWEGSRWQKDGRAPRRNATTTTIAPTGTISILAGCSGGIEPLFAVSYVRNVLEGTRLPEVHPLFVERATAGGWGDDALYRELAERGSVRGHRAVPEQEQRLFATAYDVAPIWHLRMQAAFQRHVHNSVSKTINFPQHATVEDVERAYREAYRLGCKGVTVYRDGSRPGQVLSFGAGPLAPVDTRCPSCGASMPALRANVCTVCTSCGYARCG